MAPRLEEARVRHRAIPDREVHDSYDEGTNDALCEVVQTLPPKARAVVVLRYTSS